MADGCPDPAVLAAWSEGRASEGVSEEALEHHVGGCSRCGEALEALTRERLAGLDLDRLRQAFPGDAHAPGSGGGFQGHERVSRLMREAVEGDLVPGSVPSVDPLPEFLAGLEPSSQPGSLGRFAGLAIEAILGRGGMGVVFRAYDGTLQRRVAVKVLLHERRTVDGAEGGAGAEGDGGGGNEDAGEDAEAGRFLREARAIAALRHEHVVEVYSAGRSGGWPYLVMPFHEEGTLQHWLDGGRPVALEDVARIGIQLLRALEAAHARGILHRDLKPSNVILERGLAHVRLADFGLARSAHARSGDGIGLIAGTPAYMSPEQARGENLDGRSDLFGLGALLHHLLTGGPPGIGGDIRGPGPGQGAGSGPGSGTDGPRLTRAGAGVGLEGLRRSLGAVLDRLLAPRAADRFPDAAAAREALERGLAAGEPGPGTERRRRARRVLMGVAGLALVGLGIFLGLERTGRTSVVNSLLCRASGDGFFVRGRWGTFPGLAQAAAACGKGDTVVARYHGERPAGPFRVGPTGLRVEAEAGFRPALVATNGAEALILAVGPLHLGGLTLVSRSETGEAAQLIAAEGSTIRLDHCRLVRTPAAGEDVLVRAGRRLDPDQPLILHKPLIALRSGSAAELRGCVMVGLAATAFGLRGNGAEPIRVELDGCLLAIQRVVVLRPEAENRMTVRGRDSALAFASLLEIENAQALERLEVAWDRCLLDRSGGVLLRWSRGGDGSWLRRMTWTETQVVYAGSGDFAWDRRRGAIASESQWNALVGVSGDDHRRSARPLFGEIRVRSGTQLEAADVDVDGFAADTGLPPTFRPEAIGPGAAYDRWKAFSDHRGSVVSVDGPAPATRSR